MPPENFIETRFYHLEGLFNFGVEIAGTPIPTLEELKDAYGFPADTAALNLANPADPIPELAGFAFLPVRHIESETGTETRFYTEGLKVVLVGVHQSTTGRDMLSIFPINPADAFIIPGVQQSNEVILDNSLLDFFDLGNIARWLDFWHHYNDSVEFDLVFLDRATFDHFVTSEGFYSTPPVGMRGIHFSRAAIDLTPNGETELKRFRGLKFAPYPLPELQESAGREDIAYHTGQYCPPIWDTHASESSDAAAIPVAMATIAAPQARQQPPSQNNNNPPATSVNVYDLFSLLNKAGYIVNQKKVNIWPKIMLRLLIWALLLIAGVVLVSRLAKGGGGDL